MTRFATSSGSAISMMFGSPNGCIGFVPEPLAEVILPQARSALVRLMQKRPGGMWPAHCRRQAGN